MRILYDSKKTEHKTPFGTLRPMEQCTMRVHIPASVGALHAACVLSPDEGGQAVRVPMEKMETVGAYQIFEGSFSLPDAGLYFYHFVIQKPDSSFRLFKQGNDTNMEDGDQWQLTCIPKDFSVPEWAKGAVIYQIFPDRFCRKGTTDLSGKLTPYTLHESWDEEVDWRPDEQGRVLNNDFFGGNFRGITEKMDYIAVMGTTIVYLNPICKSFSSHRYDTADYKTPDPMLGTMEEFTAMCEAAHERGIRVIIDSVFSHTGSDSVYFDRQNRFGKGAYCRQDSPYYSWYQFSHWPDSYKSWWGFDTLPTVNKTDPAFMEYILTGEDSVVSHWLRAGCDGFRLDVADELPNSFMDALRKTVRKLRPDALVIGEVWEDASNHIAYGIRRRYFTDGTLDSVMNYPFRTAILNLMRGHDGGEGLENTVMTVLENYPAEVALCNMNLLGTHDTPRILTALIDDFDGPREALAQRHLDDEQRALARSRLYAASFLQYMLPGCPSLYYGDEAGMEGYKDPFNRRTFPWGQEDKALQAHYAVLGQIHRDPVLRLGDIHFTHATRGKISFTRSYQGQTRRIFLNLSDEPWDIPAGIMLFAQNLRPTAPDWLQLAPMGFCLLK